MNLNLSVKKTRKQVFLAQVEQVARLPNESGILRFRHRLKRHKLSKQTLFAVNELLSERGLLFLAATAVNATLIATPTSTKKEDRTRDPGMHSGKKCNQCLSGVKAHNISMAAGSGPVHTARCSSGHVARTAESKPCWTARNTSLVGDAGYRRLKTAPMQKQGSLGKQLLGSCEARRSA